MKEITESLVSSNMKYVYQVGYLRGTCKGAIIELEAFLEHRKGKLSDFDYKYLNDVILGLRDGIQKSMNDTN